ncbi:hypothetical protein HDU86_001128 [Geranomyces michiganensis]|nr:hypothetical protein HDU86_001128 [Geranomyces michiganensis]
MLFTRQRQQQQQYAKGSRPSAAAPGAPAALTPLDVYKKQLVTRAVRFCLLLLVCGLVFLRRHTATNTPHHIPETYSDLRAIHVVRPEHYSLDFFANVPDAFFAGAARISISVLRPTRHINFHAGVNLTLGKDLWLESASDSRQRHNVSVLERIDDAIVSASFLPRVEIGTYTLVIPYSGAIGHRTMRGFYRSPMHDDSDDNIWIAATHFEPTFARHAFPCFDEPALKATFTISISVPSTPESSHKNMTVVSNMPVEKIQTDFAVPYTKSPAARFTFARTPLMSTYLVAWAIGALDSLEAVSVGGTNVTAYARGGMASHARLALDVAVGALDFMEKYTGMPFPLPKLDLWPIPDFGGEAMENFGLMIFEDALMMYDEHTDDFEAKQTTALLAAHEVAHQWFGDIVTMAWWDDIWLNEGFAEYLQHIILAHLLTLKTDPAAMFFALEHLPAFQADATSLSRPVASGDVRAPISSLFDDISYSKGAAGLGMLRSALEHTDDAFNAGLHLYLQNHAYGNASTRHVFAAVDDALKRAGRAPVAARMMHAWVARHGHPVLRVEEGEEEDVAADGDNEQKLSLRISQCAFALWRDGSEGCDADPPWIVPFSYLVMDGEHGDGETTGHHHRGVMHGRSWSDSVAAGPKAVVILNAGRAGFFRTLYTPAGYARIAHLLSSYPQRFQTVDRAGLVSDALAMLLAGQATQESVLPLLGFLWTERSWAVWVAAAGGLRGVLNAVYPDEMLSARWKVAAGALVANVAGWVGWRADGTETDGDVEEKSLMRRTVLEFAATTLLPATHPVVVDALRVYDAVIGQSRSSAGTSNSDPEMPPSELMDLVYAIAIAHRTDAFDVLLAAYTHDHAVASGTHTNTQHRLPGDVLAGLASTPRPAEQVRLWDKVHQEQQRRETFIAMSRHPDACRTLLTRETLHDYAIGVRMVEEAVESAVAVCVHDEVLETVRRVIGAGCGDGNGGGEGKSNKSGDSWRCETRVLALRKGLERRTAAHRFLQTLRAHGTDL